MVSYNNLLEGAKGLLGECVKVLAECKEEYIIIGGWSPLLLNSTTIKHPGTHDIDLLFKEGRKEGDLQQVIQKFLNYGFITSAKQPFQLLKVLNVAGRDFVYNVDFLHASADNSKADMFVKQLKLPILLSEYRDETYIEMSIKAPNSDILFEEGLFETVKENFLLPNGTQATINFSLMNEAGLIITKTDSVNVAKRTRDAFDIYLATKQARNYDDLVAWFQGLKYRNAGLFNSLYGIRTSIDKNGMVHNIIKHMADPKAAYAMRKEYEAEMNKFLSNAGLEEKAKALYTKGPQGLTA